MSPTSAAKEVVANLTRSTRISVAIVITLLGAVGGGGLAAGMLISKVNSIDGLADTISLNHIAVMYEIRDLSTRITVVETILRPKD